MKRVKKLTYYILLFSLILGACSRKDQEDAERLKEVHVQTESLYNDELNDLVEDISAKNLVRVEVAIESEKKEEFNEENELTLEEIEELYQIALNLYELEEDIHELFIDDIVTQEIGTKEIDQLSTRLSKVNSEKWTKYVSKHEEKLSDGRKQIESIQRAEESLDNLYLEDGQVNSEVSPEEERVAQEVVAQVKNKKIREELENRLEKVNLTLTKLEEEHKKATEGLGYFEGMYLSSDNFLLYIDKENFYIAQNVASDNARFYEVTEIIKNTGQELTLGLYEEPIEAFDIEGGNSVETFYLSDNYETIFIENGHAFERLHQNEIDGIYENLPGLKMTTTD